MIQYSGYSVHRKPYTSLRNGGLSHYYLLRMQTEGVARTVIGGISYTLKPGDLIFCPLGESYELYMDSASEQSPSSDYFLFLKPEIDWLDSWGGWWERNANAQRVHIGLDETAIILWKQLTHEYKRVKDMSRAVANHLALALLLHLERLLGDREAANGYEQSVVNQMKYFIEKNVVKPLQLSAICAHVGLSVSRASQLFKAAAGQSVMDYVIEVRLSLARSRIQHSDFTLEEISHMCGFNTYTHFNRLFRARYHCSPSVYRQGLKSK
ncbi:AraC family transcriptional regulator [Paenibacillus sp. HB172176]|uniref:AraC family transcriptional regulator n=1 Tax=Paenibacillus sp. HB172176 TaxID=2493690 RepID=UPI00143C6F20|nr:AraC family transcriptional regulator [Paenibacillus sp. HB172176]